LDSLGIRDLKISCIVGVHPHERKREQDLFVDVELWLDIGKAARTDQLVNTIDYTQVAEDLSNFIRAEQFHLVETLAQRACKMLLSRHQSLKKCRLSIRKPGALADARCAEIVVERVRGK